MSRAPKTLGIDLVDVLGARRPRGEPSVVGGDLDAAERLTVAGRGRQRAPARRCEFLHRELFRRQRLQQILLRRRRGRVDPLVVGHAEFAGQFCEQLARIGFGPRRSFRRPASQNDAVLVGVHTPPAAERGAALSSPAPAPREAATNHLNDGGFDSLRPSFSDAVEIALARWSCRPRSSGTGSPSAGGASAGTGCGFSFPTGRCGCRISRFRTPIPTALPPAARSSISSRPMPTSSPRRFAAASRSPRYDAARRRRLRRRDLGRPDRGRQCRRRHRSLSAPRHAGGVAGRRHVPDPRQHLPQSRPASAGRGAGDRLRRLRRANHRGAAACRPPGLSLGRKPPPHAAPISRARSDLVADRHGSRSNAGGSSAGRTGRCR